jgi:hypothetical protein
MTGAEYRFKVATFRALLDGVIPGPAALNERLHGHRSRNINGREARWRREVFEFWGLQKNAATGRWEDSR